MKVKHIEHDFGSEWRIYPFLNEGAADIETACAGYISVNTDTQSKFCGTVRINLSWGGEVMDLDTFERYSDLMSAAYRKAYYLAEKVKTETN